MKTTIAFAVALTAIASHALADRIRLDQLRDEDMVALQRGQSVADGACAAAVINEIDGYGGPDAMRAFTIDVEDFPIVIESVEGGIRNVCDNGIHTWIQNGEEMVMQVYDEDGQPTLDEDW